MNSNEIRDRFLEFFKGHKHTTVPSDALIPSGDPTVLFTSAGMNQFKDYFLGKRTDLTRAASIQKCLRTGDLERVGQSASHHTFFEMLGNFSFGDYFKSEAIRWAWDFLSEELKLPKNRLWASVFEEDEEARKIWIEEIGLPANRVIKLGESDNFWPANARTQGPNGPCGPCSELYFDRGRECRLGKSQCSPGCSCGKFVEVWNLVFTQFNRKEDGSLEPLPRKNIDTGMGLERLVSVVQGVETDYETDLFLPIMQSIQDLPRGKKTKKETSMYAERAMADHIRAIVFMIADGVLPSNESRGYVLRMLIRKAYTLGKLTLDIRPEGSDTFLPMLCKSVHETMKESPYNANLIEKKNLIRQAIEQEELQFIQTYESGIHRLEEIIKSAKDDKISGEEAFKLYDTYGFPIESTTSIAQERGLSVDLSGFKNALKAQQERSRKASQFGSSVFIPTTLKMQDPIDIKFVGYETLQAEATVQGIWKNGQWASTASEGEEVGIILDRSPFYGESGGQVGDKGTLECLHGMADVLDTKWVDDLLVHISKVTQGILSTNEPLRARVNPNRRQQIARSHTATHLLHWGLRKVLGTEATQAGSLVEADRIRFDFSTLKGLDEEQIIKIEQAVNFRICQGDEVQTNQMSIEDAKRSGALALFGEKYGQQVRVVSIGDYSKELCGGTHLNQTGLVGTFRIVSESSIAAGTRRIEAVVGEAALQKQQEESQALRQIAKQLSRTPLDALKGLDELMEQIKNSEKQIKNLKKEIAKVRAKELSAQAKNIGGIIFISARLEADRQLLSDIADAIRSEIKNAVIILAAKENEASLAWVMAATQDAVKSGINCADILKSISAITKGGGGGRSDFAQAGGKDPSRIEEALNKAEELLIQLLNKKA